MGGWPVWRTLREREHIILRFVDFPPSVRGVWVPTETGSVIALATWLRRVPRKCTLAHELVHDERGIGYTMSTPAALIEKEEATVRRAVAKRMVPRIDLARYVERCDDAITAEMVAEEFDVTVEVAELACRIFDYY